MDSIKDLNSLLGRHLGVNEFGESVFSWTFSEDLLWPATATGRKVPEKRVVPVIGIGLEEVEVLVPEYRQERQCAKYFNQWLIAKWCAPDALPAWEINFPGAPYPSRGYRIHTNAALAPHCLPTASDTWAFINCMKEQRSMTLKERIRDMEADRDRKEAAKHNELYDELRDLVPAFANYQPGKKGGYVCTPYSKFDRSDNFTPIETDGSDIGRTDK